MAQQPSYDLDWLQTFLVEKKYNQYEWVQQFLEDLKQIKSEGKPELATNLLQQSVKALNSGKQKEIDAKDRTAIIEAILLGPSSSKQQDANLMAKTTGRTSSGKQNDGKGLCQTLGPISAEKKTETVNSNISIVIVKDDPHKLSEDRERRSSPKMVSKGGSPMETENSPESSISGDDGKRLGGKELLTKRTQELQELQKENSDLNNKVSSLQRQLEQKQKMINEFETEVNERYGEIQNLTVENEKTKAELDGLVVSYQELHSENEQNKKRIVNVEEHYRALERKSNERINTLSSERDDLRNRYSKLAGQKLKDNSSDISDLSDPNRPMKLGVKFSELYDNEWTDVFQAQMETLKKSEKDAIQHLLGPLEECYRHCKQIAEQQMDILRDVFLYHGQDMAKPVVGAKDRLHSNEIKVLLDARKVIASNHSGQVKQLVIPLLLKRLDKADEKIHTEFIAYFEKCVEVCWLLAVNDPPLYMDMEVKVGGKVDTNLYTSYYTPGDKTDFLVWPPLYNIHKGGLINKGVIAPVLEKRKIKK